MKKVAFYGLKNRSALIRLAQWLSDRYEICAWIVEDNKVNLRYFSGKPVISIEQIRKGGADNNELFDNIIVAETPESEHIVHKLICAGIEPDKILDWRIGKNFMFENNIVCLKQRNIFYEGLIFGMSYSYWGLFTLDLDKNFFKLSAPAMDLYYINKQLQEILNENYTGFPDRTNSFRSMLKYIVLEMPYYMFNYDLSQNKVHMRKQLILADYFCDYHNYDIIDNENRKYLEQFTLWKDMFFERLKYNDSYCYFDHIVRHGSITEEMKKKCKDEISHVWTKRHEETIRENRYVFSKIVKLIHDFDSNIKLIVLVMPQSKYEYANHAEKIEQTKIEFESTITDIMDQYNMKYYYFDFFKHFFDEDKMFLDLIHLNSHGADVFSKMFDQILEKDVYV